MGSESTLMGSEGTVDLDGRHAALGAYASLVERLRRGIFPPGSRLPTERLLSDQLGVSRVTLRLALSKLEQEGRLERSAKRGWFLTRAVAVDNPRTLQSFSQMAQERGLVASAVVVRAVVRPASLDESEKLRVAPVSEVFELNRLRSLSGQPIYLDEQVIVADRVAPLLGLNLTDRSLHADLEQLCGITIARTSYSLQALPATVQCSELLELAPGAPVLVGRSVSIDQTGNPVMTGVATFRGDAYRFETDLFAPLSR